MSLITFTCASPPASFTPSVNPIYAPGYIQTKRYHQPKRLSDDGSVYSYRKGESGVRTVGWPKLFALEMTSLIAFFDTIENHVNSFTFKDRDDATYTARQVADSLTWREVEPGYYDVSVDLEIR
jgi:hypothetical protein